MANSPAHKLGQIIGDVLEEAIAPFLRKFAEDNGLYLDSKGKRLARPGIRVAWKDINGNNHDLDFVMERGGSEEQLGSPVAFIESAWRRYTKHSKNKAQEIQGAILPLAQLYSGNAPFLGAILAGEFTANSLQQLRSLGFSVLYFEYRSIIKSFSKGGIDVSFEENTPEPELQLRVDEWNELSDKQHLAIIDDIASSNRDAIEEFLTELRVSATRTIISVTITALHGKVYELISVSDAISFIHEYRDTSNALPFLRFEISINYSNRDFVRGEFANAVDALEFLSRFNISH